MSKILNLSVNQMKNFTDTILQNILKRKKKLKNLSFEDLDQFYQGLCLFYEGTMTQFKNLVLEQIKARKISQNKIYNNFYRACEHQEMKKQQQINCGETQTVNDRYQNQQLDQDKNDDSTIKQSKFPSGRTFSYAIYCENQGQILSKCKIFELFLQNKEYLQYFLQPDAIPCQLIEKNQLKLKSIQQRLKWQKSAAKILSICWKMKGANFFHEPVDPQSLGLKDYFEIVKNPVDFASIKMKIKCSEYINCSAFKIDMLLVFQNCYLYNGEKHPISLLAKNIQGTFRKYYDALLMKYEK